MVKDKKQCDICDVIPTHGGLEGYEISKTATAWICVICRVQCLTSGIIHRLALKKIGTMEDIDNPDDD